MIRAERYCFPPSLDAKVVARLRSFASIPGELARVEAIDKALHVLSQIAGTTLSMPSTFPTPEGGVQLEWSTGEWSIDVEISPKADRLTGGASAVGRTYHREFETVGEDVIGCARWLISHWGLTDDRSA